MGDCERYVKMLTSRCQVELTGSSLNGIKLVFFEVLHEFFDVSSAWLEDIPFTTAPNTQNYPLVPLQTPLGQIIRLAGVIDAKGIPQPSMMPTIGTVTLRDVPNTASPFTATVIKDVVLPCDGDNGIPAFPAVFAQRYYPGLLAGVLGKMMAQPSKPYTNDVKSVYQLRRFEGVMTQARVAAIRRNTYGTNSWAYPQQFSVGGQRGGTSTGTDQSFGGTP